MTYYILSKKGFLSETAVTISNGTIDVTFVDVEFYDSTNYRNDPVVLLNAPSEVAAGGALQAYCAASDLIHNATVGTVGTAQIAPRFEQKKRTQIRFWEGVTGTSWTATTVSAATSLDVPSTEKLGVGMLVAGTGIVTGTTITSITDSNTIVLSTAMTASAAVTITFTQPRLLHAEWADEVQRYSMTTAKRI